MALEAGQDSVPLRGGFAWRDSGPKKPTTTTTSETKIPASGPVSEFSKWEPKDGPRLGEAVSALKPPLATVAGRGDSVAIRAADDGKGPGEARRTERSGEQRPATRRRALRRDSRARRRGPGPPRRASDAGSGTDAHPSSASPGGLGPTPRPPRISAQERCEEVTVINRVAEEQERVGKRLLT